MSLFKRRAGGQQVPGDGQAPVPGSATPPARDRSPVRSHPAPGPISEWPCPDCDAGPERTCHWWCPRYADILYGEEAL